MNGLMILDKQTVVLLGIVAVWALAWKIAAIAKAVQRKDSWWIFFLAVINTLGLLEIYYIYVVSKQKVKK